MLTLPSTLMGMMLPKDTIIPMGSKSRNPSKALPGAKCSRRNLLKESVFVRLICSVTSADILCRIT